MVLRTEPAQLDQLPTLHTEATSKPVLHLGRAKYRQPDPTLTTRFLFILKQISQNEMPFYTLTGAEMVSSPLANPLLAFSTFIHGLGTQFTSRLDDTRRGLASAASFLTLQQPVNKLSLPFASVSQHQGKLENSLSTGQVAKRLVGTSLYTVCNSNKEFVLISNPDGIKSIGLLCFRKEDAEAFLAQVYI